MVLLNSIRPKDEEQRGYASLSRRDIVPAGKTSLIVNATLQRINIA
ncbi:MAG: hypothetical protein K9L62_06060 [Vallitaleaceae bacterium]|nr:hypothetical protein [Vallitaleaceae bacterium]